MNTNNTTTTKREEQLDRLAAAGFAWSGDTLYPEGTPILKASHGVYRMSHAAWESAPPAKETIDALLNSIAAEEREDVVLPVRRLAIDPVTGHLTDARTGTAWGMETAGWESVCSRLASLSSQEQPDGAPFANFATALGPALGGSGAQLRSYAFEHALSRLLAVYPDAQIALRTRNARSGGRSVFAAVSPRYHADDGAVLKAIRDEPALQGMRGRGYYSPSTGTVRVSLQLHRDKEVPAVGDVFKVGLSLRFNDAGKGGLRLGFDATRVRCVNLTTLTATGLGIARTHRQRNDVTIADFSAALQSHADMFRSFAEDWGILGATALKGFRLYGARYDSVEEAIMGAVAGGHISKRIGDRVLVEALLGARNAEPNDDSVLALINAVSRAAWEAEFDQLQQEELEMAAGGLITELAAHARHAGA